MCLHAGSINHGGASKIGDPNVAVIYEPPTNIDELIDITTWLRATFNNHVALTVGPAPHQAADTENVVRENFAQAFQTSAGVIKLSNMLADAFQRHTQNLDADNQPASTAYHSSGSVDVVDPGGIIPFRASTVPQAIALFEIVRTALEKHSLNTTVHLGNKATALRTRGPYMARLVRAWEAATKSPLATPPARTNSGAIGMVLAGGWRLATMSDFKLQC